MIAALVLNHFVPSAFQQLTFIPEDDVFASRLLVCVMDDDDFHAASAARSSALPLVA